MISACIWVGLATFNYRLVVEFWEFSDTLECKNLSDRLLRDSWSAGLCCLFGWSVVNAALGVAAVVKESI